MREEFATWRFITPSPPHSRSTSPTLASVADILLPTVISIRTRSHTTFESEGASFMTTYCTKSHTHATQRRSASSCLDQRASSTTYNGKRCRCCSTQDIYTAAGRAGSWADGEQTGKNHGYESPMHRATGPLIQGDAQLLQRYRHELVQVDPPRGQLRFTP